MFNCSGCWDNPCTCGKDYDHLSRDQRNHLAAALLGKSVSESQPNPFVKVETITKTKLVCPHCGEATNSIDHLLTGKHHSIPYTGKWNCGNEKCLREYEFTIGADKQVKSVVKTDKPPKLLPLGKTT